MFMSHLLPFWLNRRILAPSKRTPNPALRLTQKSFPYRTRLFLPTKPPEAKFLIESIYEISLVRDGIRMGSRFSPYAILFVVVGVVSLLQALPQQAGNAQPVPQDILPPTVTIVIPEPVYIYVTYTQYRTTTLIEYQTAAITSVSISHETNTVSQSYTQISTYTQPLSPMQENASLIAASTAIVGAVAGYALGKPRRKKWPNRDTCPTCGGSGMVPGGVPIQPGLQPGTPSISPGRTPIIGPGSQPLSIPVSPGLPVTPFAAPRGTQQCVHCGKAIRSGVQFCPNCGIKVSKIGPL
jgi:hypothetical protein